jgi:hypothetical protein
VRIRGSTILEPSSQAAYWKLVVTGDGERVMADPYGYIDGGAVPGGAYDFCCVFKPWKGEALPQLLSPALAKMINSSEMLAFVQRRAHFGTWTQPDPCAPPVRASMCVCVCVCVCACACVRACVCVVLTTRGIVWANQSASLAV